MGRAPLARTLVVLLLLALGLPGCASPAKATGPSKHQLQLRAEETRRKALSDQLDQARSLASTGKHDRAIKIFLDVLGASRVETAAADQALLGASLALHSKVSDFRLPGQLDAFIKFYGQLPAGTRPEAASKMVDEFLLEPVAREAEEAGDLLENRRQFVKDIRSTGTAKVFLTPDKDRLLTEAEVKDASGHLKELGASADYVKLYGLSLPLAKTMDRFLADDKRYLDGKYVTDNDIDELAKSCDALASVLWPVQRQLDRLKPNWR